MILIQDLSGLGSWGVCHPQMAIFVHFSHGYSTAYIYIYKYIYQMVCVCQRYHKECSTRTCADDCYNCWEKPKLKSYVRPWQPPWRKGRITYLWNKSVFNCLAIGIIHETMVVHMIWVWTFFNNYIYIYVQPLRVVYAIHFQIWLMGLSAHIRGHFLV